MANEIRDHYNSIKGLKVDYKVDWTETTKSIVTGVGAGKITRSDYGIDPLVNLPVNTIAPAITGISQVGQTLTVTNGTWTGTPEPTFTRQWMRTGKVITGATGLTYIPVLADIGKVLTCVVTGTNTLGVVTATSNATDPVIAA